MSKSLPCPAQIIEKHHCIPHAWHPRAAIRKISYIVLREEAALEIMRHGDGKDLEPALLVGFFQNLPVIRRIEAQHPDAPRAGAESGLNCLPGDLAALAEA